MTERTGGGMMQQKESAARQALRKKRARKRAIRLAGAAALAAALGALTVCVILPGMDGGQGADEPKAQKQTATAALGTIEKTVFGAGEVQPASQPGVYAQTDGEISGRGRRQREGRGRCGQTRKRRAGRGNCAA